MYLARFAPPLSDSTSSAPSLPSTPTPSSTPSTLPVPLSVPIPVPGPETTLPLLSSGLLQPIRQILDHSGYLTLLRGLIPVTIHTTLFTAIQPYLEETLTDLTSSDYTSLFSIRTYTLSHVVTTCLLAPLSDLCVTSVVGRSRRGRKRRGWWGYDGRSVFWTCLSVGVSCGVRCGVMRVLDTWGLQENIGVGSVVKYCGFGVEAILTAPLETVRKRLITRGDVAPKTFGQQSESKQEKEAEKQDEGMLVETEAPFTSLGRVSTYFRSWRARFIGLLVSDIVSGSLDSGDVY